MYGSYATFSEARTACAVDSGCGAVYDAQCDDTGTFRLCPTNWDELSSVDSCLFLKLGNIRQQYNFIVEYRIFVSSLNSFY